MEDENGSDDDDVCHEIDYHDEIYTQFLSDQERGCEECDRLHVPGRYPEPGGEGTAPIREYTNALVYGCMKEIEDSDEDKGDADEEEVVVLDDASGFPDKEKNCNGNCNRGDFDRGMEKGKIVPAYQIKDRDDEKEEDTRDDVWLQV